LVAEIILLGEVHEKSRIIRINLADMGRSSAAPVHELAWAVGRLQSDFSGDMNHAGIEGV
jgi:hypothetical protein